MNDITSPKSWRMNFGKISNVFCKIPVLSKESEHMMMKSIFMNEGNYDEIIILL